MLLPLTLLFASDGVLPKGAGARCSSSLSPWPFVSHSTAVRPTNVHMADSKWPGSGAAASLLLWSRRRAAPSCLLYPVDFAPWPVSPPPVSLAPPAAAHTVLCCPRLH